MPASQTWSVSGSVSVIGLPSSFHSFFSGRLGICTLKVTGFGLLLMNSFSGTRFASGPSTLLFLADESSSSCSRLFACGGGGGGARMGGAGGMFMN